MRRATIWVSRKTDVRFTSMIWRNVAGGSSSAGTGSEMPALLTSRSTRPVRPAAVSTKRARSASTVTSQATAVAPGRSAANFSSRSTRRAPITTRAPAALRTRAKRSPMPLEAPVRMATRPSRRNRALGSATSVTAALYGHHRPPPPGGPVEYNDFQHLRFERRPNGVVLVTIDRPDVLNAADERLHRELSEVWATFDADDSARVAVITGAGKAFSAGGDLSMIEEMTVSYDAVLVQLRDAAAIVTRMMETDKPIVSAINGVAVGAGLAVALLADISIMSETARITDGHLRLGVAAGDHAAVVWPLLCGMAKAKYYLLTADFLDGREAERIGLVSRCVPEAEVLDAALEIADRLGRGSQNALRWTKRSLNGWLRMAMPIFEHSLALEMLGFLGADAAEGVAAVKEKRPARFPSAQED